MPPRADLAGAIPSADRHKAANFLQRVAIHSLFITPATLP
jgi:hypothetical protein